MLSAETINYQRSLFSALSEEMELVEDVKFLIEKLRKGVKHDLQGKPYQHMGVEEKGHTVILTKRESQGDYIKRFAKFQDSKLVKFSLGDISLVRLKDSNFINKELSNRVFSTQIEDLDLLRHLNSYLLQNAKEHLLAWNYHESIKQLKVPA
mmetsp:Transcript_10058/g.10000  ORF Transcript_10058/g.10000 Transcript_10058/m.10000 type:complete len:152 (-) Transcript_10058:73-528(-)